MLVSVCHVVKWINNYAKLFSITINQLRKFFHLIFLYIGSINEKWKILW